jgi:glycosyltransferase involved in cell wall biosynthesis
MATSPPQYQPAQKRLVVVVPALNEAATIERVVRGVPATIPGVSSREILVIDDGSADETASKARAAGASVVSHVTNRGVGVAFQTGLREALRRKADIIVHIDGDGQFDPQDIPTLVRPVLEGRADITTCTRFADPRRYPEMPPLKVWGNRMVRTIINLTTGQRFTDVSCGFRAYSRDAALRLTLFGKFTYTHEVILDAVQKGLRIFEVPLTVRGEREAGRSRVASNVLVYGLQWLAIFFRAFRDSSPFQVFGVLATVTEAGGVGTGLFVLMHWLNTGQTFPYRSLVILSGVLILLGAFLFTVALLADMLRRQRLLIEELLYFMRKSVYDTDHGGS